MVPPCGSCLSTCVRFPGPVTAPEHRPPQAAAPGAEEAGGTPGLIPPMSRGHTGGFITDAIVELGYATPEQVEQAIAQARTAGKRPEELLLEQGAIDSDQLSRAIAERYGLDHVDLVALPGRHGRGQPDLGRSRPAATRRCRSASSTRARCWSRWPTRPTCSRSTTSRWRPA